MAKKSKAHKAKETADLALPYTVGEWKGLPRWQCNLCPFDTLAGEEAILEHIYKVHMPPQQPERPQIIKVDRFGNPVGE